MNKLLLPAEEVFIAEYLLDFDARRAAQAAGFSRSRGPRLLEKPTIAEEIRGEAMARRERLRIDADRITDEFAKIALANARDFEPEDGQVLRLRRLTADQTAAVDQLTIQERIDPETGVITRQTNLKLHDKVGALNSLAKSVGMMNETHFHHHTFEQRIIEMTPQERVELARAMLADAQKYLPAYEAAVEAGEIVEGDDKSEAPAPLASEE